MPSDGDSLAGYSALGREGWIGLHWPRAARRRGLSPAATLAAEERFGYHWLPLSGYLLSVKTIGNALLACAGDELAERLLPAIAAGELVFCQGFSEPEAGSDLAALRTHGTSRRRALRGVRAQDLDLERPDRGLDLPGRAHRPRGASARTAASPCCWRTCARPGIEMRDIPTLGGGALFEVFLDGWRCRPASWSASCDGGWEVLMRTLDHERVTSEKVGVVLRVLDDLDALAADGPAERRELRRLRGEAEAARLHGRRAVELLEAGRPGGGRGLDGQAVDRARWCAAPPSSARACSARRGWSRPARTHRRPAAWPPSSRACAGSTIAGGAAEIQRRVIARMGLGSAA